jgi:hypothetical protein
MNADDMIDPAETIRRLRVIVTVRDAEIAKLTAKYDTMLTIADHLGDAANRYDKLAHDTNELLEDERAEVALLQEESHGLKVRLYCAHSAYRKCNDARRSLKAECNTLKDKLGSTVAYWKDRLCDAELANTRQVRLQAKLEKR